MNGVEQVPGLTDRVRDRVYRHVFDHLDHEVGGVLVGHLTGSLPLVTGAIPALEARGERASVTFTHDAWATVHEVLDRDYPGQSIVGWYHSHPGFGIFLSHHDLFIHRNFFSDPGQIAYVIDPHAGTEGVFGWRGSEVEKLSEVGTRRPPAKPKPHSGGGRVQAAGRGYPLLGLALPLLLGLVVGVLATVVLREDPAPAAPAGATRDGTSKPRQTGRERRSETREENGNRVVPPQQAATATPTTVGCGKSGSASCQGTLPKDMPQPLDGSG
jgi:proteasome lid subunit RPN8/RPN11